jgi:hypothetical protein
MGLLAATRAEASVPLERSDYLLREWNLTDGLSENLPTTQASP